jgi:hypothetical protein
MYGTARFFLTLSEVMAWLAVFAGVVIAFVLGVQASKTGFGQVSTSVVMIAAMPGAICSVIGIWSVVLVQVGRANVDIADMTHDLLVLSRKQLEAINSSGFKRSMNIDPAAESQRKQEHINIEPAQWPRI